MDKMVDTVSNSGGMTYRELQQQFISDLNGTSTLEIAVVVSSAPLSVLAHGILLSLLIKLFDRRHWYVIQFLNMMFNEMLLAS